MKSVSLTLCLTILTQAISGQGQAQANGNFDARIGNWGASANMDVEYRNALNLLFQYFQRNNNNQGQNPFLGGSVDANINRDVPNNSPVNNSPKYPEFKPVPAPAPNVVPAPQPAPIPAPQPEPAPVPRQEPAPAPQPAPVPAPVPRQEPAPAPQLAPVVAPQPAPEPAPQPAPVPAPDPKVELAPMPREPQPTPVPFVPQPLPPQVQEIDDSYGSPAPVPSAMPYGSIQPTPASAFNSRDVPTGLATDDDGEDYDDVSYSSGVASRAASGVASSKRPIYSSGFSSSRLASASGSRFASRSASDDDTPSMSSDSKSRSASLSISRSIGDEEDDENAAHLPRPTYFLLASGLFFYQLL